MSEIQVSYFYFGQPRLKIRPVLRFPPPSIKTFPERSDAWADAYPALIKPWIGGVRAFWLVDQQAFQLQDGRVIRVDGIEPEVPDGIDDLPPRNLLGEFYEKGATYGETLSRVLNNEPTDNLDFNIYDAEMEAPAKERAAYCLQIPRQYDFHVRTVDMYEVHTPGGFRTFLEGWRKAFNGGLAVGYQDPWLATEYEVKTLL
jgi:hypothetical protein